MRDSPIRYEIRADGTCSYCGLTARVIELPDGDIDYSDQCILCDDYNMSLWLEEAQEPEEEDIIDRLMS